MLSRQPVKKSSRQQLGADEPDPHGDRDLREWPRSDAPQTGYMLGRV